MSIIPSKTPADPYAALAWTASVADIALDKLSLLVTLDATEQQNLDVDLILDGDEEGALPALSKEARLLSKASKISARDLFVANASPLSAELRESFSTLVAIERDFYAPGARPDFEKMSDDLDFIYSHVKSGNIKSLPPKIIADAQRACLKLLEHLDNHRHSMAPH
ncbi:MAG: hypothetical protein QOH41_1787 [Blastocatellia bacterium]|jgi:hypothetical protein|nr:hypothetical protein [Blastocatellia bacterium]